MEGNELLFLQDYLPDESGGLNWEEPGRTPEPLAECFWGTELAFLQRASNSVSLSLSTAVS